MATVFDGLDGLRPVVSQKVSCNGLTFECSDVESNFTDIDDAVSKFSREVFAAVKRGDWRGFRQTRDPEDLVRSVGEMNRLDPAWAASSAVHKASIGERFSRKESLEEKVKGRLNIFSQTSVGCLPSTIPSTRTFCT